MTTFRYLPAFEDMDVVDAVEIDVVLVEVVGIEVVVVDVFVVFSSQSVAYGAAGPDRERHAGDTPGI